MEAKINATMTGFIIGMILVAMFASVFATMFSKMEVEYGVGIGESNNSFAKYSNYTDDLELSTEKIRNETDFQQKTGVVDIIGGFFSSGYAALKTAITSFNLFGTMMDDASSDIEEISFFKTYLMMIIAILIFVGIAITVLVKIRM